MKKLKVILAMIVMLATLFTVGFAEGEDYILTADFDGTNVVVKMVAQKDANIGSFCSVPISFDSDVWTYVSGTSSVNNVFNNDPPKITWDASISNDAIVSKGDVVFEMTFSLNSGKSPYGTAFTPTEVCLWDGTTYVHATVGSVTIASPVVVSANTSTTIEADDATYTDVVNFDSSLTNVTAINPTLKFDLYEDGTKYKSYSVELGHGVTLEGGTLSFKIAVIGAPADKAITLVNPTIAE